MIHKLTVLVVLAGTCFVYYRQPYAQGQKPHETSAKTKSNVEQDIKLLREDIRARKKQLIAANLKLTADQAAKFWPIYDQYAAELSRIGDRQTARINEYTNQWGTMTDEQSSRLAKQSLALDERIAQLRVKYLLLFDQAVPGQVVATFFQLDRRFQALREIQLASQIPLVQDQN